jgi:uncharacterized membrane-anchored protein
MRTKIMIALSVLVLAVLNYGIYEKEQIKENGETLLLELVPRDPRSLMQGDYMQLRYAIGRKVPVKELASHQKRGYMVIRPDENNVAQFARLHKGEDLIGGEKLLHFHKKYSSVRIVPDSFFFQEGHAKSYRNAKYGVFKFDDSGNHLLVGLADENRKTIIGSPAL